MGIIIGNLLFDVIDLDVGVMKIYFIDCFLFNINLIIGVVIFRYICIEGIFFVFVGLFVLILCYFYFSFVVFFFFVYYYVVVIKVIIFMYFNEIIDS